MYNIHYTEFYTGRHDKGRFEPSKWVVFRNRFGKTDCPKKNIQNMTFHYRRFFQHASESFWFFINCNSTETQNISISQVCSVSLCAVLCGCVVCYVVCCEAWCGLMCAVWLGQKCGQHLQASLDVENICKKILWKYLQTNTVFVNKYCSSNMQGSKWVWWHPKDKLSKQTCSFVTASYLQTCVVRERQVLLIGCEKRQSDVGKTPSRAMDEFALKKVRHKPSLGPRQQTALSAIKHLVWISKSKENLTL